MNIFKISEKKIKYIALSTIDKNYTEKMNAEYCWMAKVYDLFLFLFPLWKKWIKKIIPYIIGENILEVSFGNGYLMTKYGINEDFKINGIEYNENMIKITKEKIKQKNIIAKLFHANVEKLPFENNFFDTIINTMAFTGYPDGDKAFFEIKRVLKPGGRLLIVDFDYPRNRNIFGYFMVKIIEKFGDIIKDINFLLRKYKFEYVDYSIGGFGSVHLFICKKKELNN